MHGQSGSNGVPLLLSTSEANQTHSSV